MSNNVLAVIPARGGSKGIPRKNIKLLAGKPLLAYTAEATAKSRLLDRVILSTEDPEIREFGLQLGLETPFVRPLDLAEDDTPGLSVIQHAVRTMEEQENYRADAVVMLQPTSPLRTPQHIDEALKIFLESNADSLVSVVRVPHNMNPYSVMELNDDGTVIPFLDYDENKNLRQKKPKFYGRNGPAIQICTYECLLEKSSLFGEKILPYFMNKEDSLDLDDLVDWKVLEAMLGAAE